VKKFLIVVEGIADAVFIKSVLFFLFERNEKFSQATALPKKKQKDAEKEIDRKIKNEEIAFLDVFVSPKIKIAILGGCTKIKKFSSDLIEYHQNGFNILMIQDADAESKDFGTLNRRMNYLEEQKQSLNLEFDTFLFPNHQDDGDLETLLLQIVHQEKFADFSKCYNSYVSCVKNFCEEKDTEKELLENKNQIFSFVASYQGRAMAAEGVRNYNTELWDLENKALMPLKSFLQKHLG
jgi:hypothetical protein